MADQMVILVTGVSEYWGSRVAARLVDLAGSKDEEQRADTSYHVIGLDINPPQEKIKGLDFIQADIRNPLLVDLLKSEQVHTVCHLAFLESTRPAETPFDYNVMGTMKVFGACSEAGVRKIVYKSSTAVYGALPGNPAFLSERSPLQGSRSFGITRDLVEIEAFLNGFRRQVPEMIQTTLRFPSVVGPSAETPMTRYLKQPWHPTLMGFDPLMQIIHEEDVVGALVYAALNDVPGVFNVAAEGVIPLTMLLSLAGKMHVPVFHPFAYWGRAILGRRGLRFTDAVPYELDYLRYPWVADLGLMRSELGFVPHYTAEETLREFAGAQRLQKYMPETLAMTYDEERLRDTIDRRQRARSRQEMDMAKTGDGAEEGNLDE